MGILGNGKIPREDPTNSECEDRVNVEQVVHIPLRDHFSPNIGNILRYLDLIRISSRNSPNF